HYYPANGVLMTGGVLINDGPQRNRIGTNGDGTSDDLERNIISGNDGDGIDIGDSDPTHNIATLNVVAGNFIGTQPDGTTPLHNNADGIYMAVRADGNHVGVNPFGGPSLGALGNVIAANLGYGLDLFQANQNVMAGNFIGVDKTGDAALANLLG